MTRSANCAGASTGRASRGQPGLLRAHLAADPGDDLSRQLGRVLQVAEQQLGTPITPVEHITVEGRLSSDPEYRASAAATSQLETVYAWTVCARLAAAPLGDRCQAAAVVAISGWTSTYQPSGNPIDEARLIPLLQSIDLATPLLSREQQGNTLAWVSALEARGEAFYAALSPSATSRSCSVKAG